MKLPPIEVYTSAFITEHQLKLALNDYLQVECVNDIHVDETKFYVTFQSITSTPIIESFLENLIEGVSFTHKHITYKAFTQYI